jgi:Concanavalin A-like lectin/glucanases superfamily
MRQLLAGSLIMFLWSSDLVNYKLWADIGIIRFQGVQALTVNHWYHVAVVFDGSAAVNRRVRMYVNGAL